jgi:hypothetical protein
MWLSFGCPSRVESAEGAVMRALTQALAGVGELPHMQGDFPSPPAGLKRDDFSSNRHPALGYWWSMMFSENRYPLFGIML